MGVYFMENKEFCALVNKDLADKIIIKKQQSK